MQHNTFIILRVRPALLSCRTIAVLLAGSGRRFIPEFTICLAEMRPRGGGTTLTQHLIATTVALLLICICFYFYFLQTCRFLRDYQMEFAAHEQCNCCNLGITRCKKKSSMSSCVQSCKGKVCTFKSAAAFCWSLLVSVVSHARPL